MFRQLFLGALLIASAPSFCEVPCRASLTIERETLTPSQLIEFYDALSGPGSGTLRELIDLADIKTIRFARRPWIRETRLKGRRLILPYPKSGGAEELARTYLSIFAPLRLRALRRSVSPFGDRLADYQKRTVEILARSEFQAYDVLFYLAPQLLSDNVTEEGARDISWRDRRRLSKGQLPSFVMPSLDRAANGWALAKLNDADAAITALEENVPKERLNFLWFGDTEHRLKRGFWRAVRYATLASGLFSLWEVGPELVLVWNAREQIYRAASTSSVIPLTPESLDQGRRDMRRFYLRRIEETKKELALHPRSERARADLEYYQGRAAQTETSAQRP